MEKHVPYSGENIQSLKHTFSTINKNVQELNNNYYNN